MSTSRRGSSSRRSGAAALAAGRCAGVKARDVGLATRQRAEALQAALERHLADEALGPRPVVAERGEQEVMARYHRQPAVRGTGRAPWPEIDLQRGVPEPAGGPGIGRDELLSSRAETRATPALQLDERDAQGPPRVAQEPPRRAIGEAHFLRSSTQRRSRADRREQRGEAPVEGRRGAPGRAPADLGLEP